MGLSRALPRLPRDRLLPALGLLSLSLSPLLSYNLPAAVRGFGLPRSEM